MIPQIVVQCENSSDPMTLKIVQSELCIRALKIYLERSTLFRQSEQLFVCFGNRIKGHPVTKHRLSRWMVDAITLASSAAEPLVRL